MRHRISGYQLNRNTASRNGLRRSLIISLFANNRIKTTETKANAIRGDAEKLPWLETARGERILTK
jgi:large subunit ribosomal protein L17